MSQVLPNQICQVCANHTLSTFSFHELCKQSDTQWHQNVDNIKNMHVPEDAANLYVACDHGEIKTYHDSRHRKYHKAQTKKQAFKNFKTRFDRNMIGKPSETRMTCPTCYKQFGQAHKFNIHIREYQLRMCTICQEICTLDDFFDHLTSNHEVAVESCPLCLKVFESKQACDKHLLKHEQGMFCNVCHKLFTKLELYEKHASVHEPQSCRCGRSFLNKNCYKYHSKNCSKALKVEKEAVKKYICDVCDKRFVTKNGIKNHIETIHFKIRRYQCEKCGKKFMNRWHLLEHDNFHERVDDRYVCSICPAKYSTRRGYERHLKNHHGENVDERRIRRKTVTARQKIFCEMCNENFRTEKAIIKHAAVVHGITLTIV